MYFISYSIAYISFHIRLLLIIFYIEHFNLIHFKKFHVHSIKSFSKFYYWLFSRLESRSLSELTRQIAPPTRNDHAPPTIELRKSSHSANMKVFLLNFTFWFNNHWLKFSYNLFWLVFNCLELWQFFNSIILCLWFDFPGFLLNYFIVQKNIFLLARHSPKYQIRLTYPIRQWLIDTQNKNNLFWVKVCNPDNKY